MTRYHYEVWAPKGDQPLCKFDTADMAWDFADRRAPVVPGLRVQTVITTVRRLETERPSALRRVA